MRNVHPKTAATQMSRFTTALSAATGETFGSYATLHDFTVREYRAFWRCFLSWCEGLEWSGSPDPVCVGDTCEDARFFPDVTLNYADNVLNLTVAPADAPALTARYAGGRRVRLTRGRLRERVARLGDALTRLGVRPGDRIAGVLRNDADAVVVALAAAAVGATLSTVSTEMGLETVLERFAPLEPRLLFAHTAARAYDAGVLADTVSDLAAALPSLQTIVTLDDGPLRESVNPTVYSLAALIDLGDSARFVWRRFPFNHPLFIMFSSGTTGKPKCIVHGAGGALLEHLKEHRLHTDLRPGDRMYFHTSCAWMMWNWQLSALASGVEIVTYDGPISAVDTLWRLVAEERVSVFGTSPAYLKMCEDTRLEPGVQFDLGALRAVLSTGAVLFDSQFGWVREHVKAVPVQSISGGTDILGCFVLGHPELAVVAGEAQCKSLGLDVQAWRDGKPANGIGELVCTTPFPSRPLGFFDDPGGARFHAAYFAQNAGVWTHGDLIAFSASGGARLHGRSDGVLNVRGVKVGPGEIYRVLSAIPEVREAIAVEQTREQRIVLMLVLQQGVTLTPALQARVRDELARRASRAHVPGLIIAVDEIPLTHSGKLCEAAARAAVNGLPIPNAGALRNPACLEAIRNHAQLTASPSAIAPAGTSRDELERHLCSLWENVFGCAPIGRDDDFFQLGGHSVLAARLLAEVERSTGRALPLATLMVAPTVARLAALIEDSSLPPPSATLVPMRVGSGNPLFIVHSVTGTVMECWTLARALKSSRPIYGLQAHGIDGTLPAQRRVEEMAATYIGEMRSVQPHGPYAIAGYSFGGLVAFEIAQQLRRGGEEIELLCLLDTYVHERWLPWDAWLRHQLGRVRRRGRRVLELPASQRLAYLTQRLAARVRRPDATAGEMTPLARVREAFGQAMRAYRPRPYQAGPIVYVRAGVAQREWPDPMALWRRVARGGLHIAEAAGDHNDMIFEPNVAGVAAALDRSLVNA